MNEAFEVTLDEALRGLREGISHRKEGAREIPLGPRWARAFQALRRRAGALGMSERSAYVDDFGMDRDAVNRSRPLLDFLADRYWKLETRGAENLPTTTPYVLVANAGGPIPYDGIMLAHAIARIRQDMERPHFLVADWLFATPFAQPTVTRLGGVRACHDNARRLLQRSHSFVSFPEGFRGSARPFMDRYRLAPFGVETGIRAAVEAGVPLVPVGIVGAEEATPVLYKDAISGRFLGLPFVPVTPTFPVLGPLGLLPLPSKWVITIGKPLALEGCDDLSSASLVARAREGLADEVQALVAEGLESRESVWS